MEERLEKLEKRLARLEALIGTKLTQEQARKYIGVSRHTMIKYRRLGVIPAREDGSRVYYNITDLEKFCS